MGGEVRRVPVDFDWPIGKIWDGFLMPESLHELNCRACGGEGYGPEARAIARTFYPHQIGGPNADVLAWHDKLGQAEVDNLVAEGRLRTLVNREPTDDNPRDWEWVSVPRAAAEVNEQNRRPGLDGHDAINRMILVEFRCKALGIPLRCPDCKGHGSVEVYPGQRADAEQWEETDPPIGDGWQVWETVSEGSPISPVFPDREGLIGWLMSPEYNWGTSRPLTREQAEAFTESGWAPTFIVSAATGLVNGEQYMAGA